MNIKKTPDSRLHRLSVSDTVHISHEPEPVYYAAVSNDEKYIAYTFGKEGSSGLWIRSADPGQVVLPSRLVNTGTAIKSPCFSPDGDRLAYVGVSHDVKGDIFLVSMINNNSDPIRLTDRDTEDGYPSFSPDGKKIYLHQQRPGDGNRYLACLEIDNPRSRIKILDTGGDGSFPCVSPDGKKLTFVSYRYDPGGDIFLLDLEGGGLRQVTKGTDLDIYPVWSNDSKYIYFSRYSSDSNRNGRIDLDDNAVIYRLEIDNPVPFPLTSGSYSARQTLRVGKQLYFLSDKNGISNLFALPPHGEIGQEKDAEIQNSLAGELAEKLPRDNHLAILGYLKIPEFFPEERKACVKAYMAAAELYKREGIPETAGELYMFAYEKYPDILPEAVVSGIRGISVNAVLEKNRINDNNEKNLLLREKIDEIEKITSAYSGRPEIFFRGKIETALLLKEKVQDSGAMFSIIDLLDNLLEKNDLSDSSRAEALLIRADTYSRTGNAESILESYIKIIKDFPEQTGWAREAVERIISNEIGSGDYSNEDKIERLNRIVEENKEDLPVLAMGAINRIGDIYYSDDEWEQAKDSYRKILDNFNTVSAYTAAARFALAEILYRQEYFRDAVYLYEGEMKKRPYDDYIYKLARDAYIKKSIASAEYLYRIGEVASAGDIFFDLMKEDYRIVEAHRGYIKCAYAQRKIAPLLEIYKAGLVEFPDDPVLLYATGLCMTYLDTKRALMDSKNLIQKAIQRFGQSEYFHQTLGYIYETLEKVYGEKGQYEPALESYKKALFLNSGGKNPENRNNLLLNLGNIYMNLDQYTKAFEFYLQRLKSEEPFDNQDAEFQYYRNLGIAAFRSGDSVIPIKAFKKVIDIIDKKIDLNPIAMTGVTAGKKLGKKQVYQAQNTSDPGLTIVHLKAEMLDRLGLAYQESDRYNEAFKTFEESFEINRTLGLTGNLAANKRSAAYNLYLDAGNCTGIERNDRLNQSLQKFGEVRELVGLYGVASKKSQTGGEGLLNLSFDVALDETASTSALYGFTKEQEMRLADSFISRIEIELGNFESSAKFLDEQLTAYDSMEIPDKDLYGVSLLYHRAGHLGYAMEKSVDAFNRFRKSAELAIRLNSPVSAAINIRNMGFTLLQLDMRNAGNLTFLYEFEALENKVSLLLGEKLATIASDVISQYYNATGIIYSSLYSEIDEENALNAVIRMRMAQKGVVHLTNGLKFLDEIDIKRDRNLLEIKVAMHINLADISVNLGDPAAAEEHYKKAVEYAGIGLLPEYEWRAYAGLNQYDKALMILQNVNILRAGCGSGEIINRLHPIVDAILEEDMAEDAFNLLERLSELERVNRLAFAVRNGIDRESKKLLRALYQRIAGIDNLKKRLDESGEEGKKFFLERLSQERSLLKKDMAALTERYYLLSTIPEDTVWREQFISSLGLAADIEYTADRIVSAGDNSSKEEKEMFIDLNKKYQESIKELVMAARKGRNPGIAGIIAPDPVEAIDVMDILARETMSCVRFFRKNSSEWKTIYLSPEDIKIIDIRNGAIPEEFNEFGFPTLIFEDPSVLPFLKDAPVSLNATQFVRSVRQRKPFKS